MDSTKKILLIDDEEVIIFGFSMVLKEPGVDVYSAQTLQEAQHCIAAHTFDAALVDLRLSNSTLMEGFDCIRLLRSSQSKCRIIVVSAFGENSIKEQAQALGVDYFFEKPVEPWAIKEILKTFGIFNK